MVYLNVEWPGITPCEFLFTAIISGQIINNFCMKHLLSITILFPLFWITPVSAEKNLNIRVSTAYSRTNSSSDRVARIDRVQLYSTELERKYEYDADLKAVVLAARAGYDPYALLDVMTNIDSINPNEASLTVMSKTHPPTAEHLDLLARAMDGYLDKYADGQINSGRFLEAARGGSR